MAREVTEFVTPADLDAIPDGTTYKRMSATEQTKLTGIEAKAKDDQTGAEIQTAIVGLSDAVKKIVLSEPLAGEKKIYGIHRNAAGNLEMDSESIAV